MKGEIETNRLNLKLITISDLESIHELHSLPETDKFNTLGIPNNISETEKLLEELIDKNNNEKKTNFTFKVELNDKKSFIGLISLNLGNPKFKNAEVWYKFHSNFRGKGYAKDCVQSFLTCETYAVLLHLVSCEY